MNKYLTAAAGLIIGSMLMLVVTPAMARVDVDLNIGIPGGYVQPAPVYVQPRPVYVQPQPVYVQPQPVYVQSQPYWRGRHWQERHWHGHHDRDHDGVPNRYDRRPNDPYRY